MKKTSLFLSLIAVVILAMANRCQAASIKVSETPLMTFDKYLGTLDGVGETLLVSPNCQHVATVLQTDGEVGWEVDGNTPRYFSQIGPGQWSPDSNHFAYSVSQGNQWRTLVNGKMGDPFSAMGPPVWSPDSSKIAYVAQVGDKFIIVNGTQKSSAYEGVRNLQFSADGTKLAAIVHKNGQDFLWINGQEKAPADEIQQFVWSANGAHYAYAARSGTSWNVYHDDAEGKAVESVQLVTISPDGQHVAYVATIGGLPTAPPGEQSMVASSVKTQLLIADEKTLDSQSGATFTYTGIVYSPDSQHLAWTAGYFGQGMSVFANGHGDPAYTNVSAPVWSADSAHLAYGTVRVDQNTVTKYMVTDSNPSVAFQDITQPIWNPAAPILAFAAVPDAQKSKCVVFSNGKSSPPYDTATDLLFSADGKNFSYLALGDKGAFAVINGTNSPVYDGFLGNVKSSFDAAGHLHVMALKGHKVMSVEFALEG